MIDNQGVTPKHLQNLGNVPQEGTNNTLDPLTKILDKYGRDLAVSGLRNNGFSTTAQEILKLLEAEILQWISEGINSGKLPEGVDVICDRLVRQQIRNNLLGEKK